LTFMFRLRKEQLDRIAMKRFIDRVETTLLQHWFARRVFDQEKAAIPLRGMIEHGVTVAQSYGLQTEQELVMFVMHMIDINPEFHKQPHFQRLLQDRSLTFRERSDKILQEVTRADWEAAARIGDPHAYWLRVLPAADRERTRHGEH